MKTKTLLLILATGLFVFSSCQKEGDSQGGTNDKLLGTWKFVAMKANVKTTTMAGSGVDQEKVVSSYSFDATDPVGTITFDAAKATSSGLGYSYDTDVLTELYLGGALFHSFDIHMADVMPPSSGSVPYKAIGTDSIYFQSGFLSFDPAGGGTGTPTATVPTGSRISWLNDTLVLNTIIAHTSTQNVNGVTAQVRVDAQQIVKLKK